MGRIGPLHVGVSPLVRTVIDRRGRQAIEFSPDCCNFVRRESVGNDDEAVQFDGSNLLGSGECGPVRGVSAGIGNTFSGIGEGGVHGSDSEFRNFLYAWQVPATPRWLTNSIHVASTSKNGGAFLKRSQFQMENSYPPCVQGSIFTLVGWPPDSGLPERDPQHAHPVCPRKTLVGR